ncbi:hypothetical protein BDW59DRAFT_140415 [Aspergillus cavernicola]|uniref:Mid2 domain-containing protein n=1 Tax=Aspergillus cavernicola TaxID=176166 RepID=A0ABR4ITL8_9EURO
MFLPRLIIHSALLSTSLAASCYFSDGSYGSSEQQPCFPDQEVSACCGLAKATGDENDYCLTSGICLGQVAGYTGFMMLNSCTDSSWESDDCPNICPRSTRASHGIHILPCLETDSSHWCCSVDGSDCCDDAFEFDIGTLMFPDGGSNGNWTNPTSVVNPPTSTNAGSIESISTNSDQPTTTVTITARPTADSDTASDSASPSETTCDNGTCPDSKTAVVGVGVGLGAALVVCLLSSAGALWFQRRVFKKRLEDTRASFLAAGYMPAPHAQAELFAPHARPSIAELPLNKPRTVFEM